MEDLDELIEAIRRRRRITFSYGGVRRHVEPIITGCNADGLHIMEGWQVVGDGTGIRTFELRLMRDLKVTDLTFVRKPPEDVVANPRFSIIHKTLQ